MKKRILLITITALSILNLGCSGTQVTENNIKNELRMAADSIKKDKKNIYKLDSRIIGKKGYFYVISNDGRISYHPKKALINFDFSTYPFVQKILRDRNGCISFNAEGARRYVFFDEIDRDEILCLTIEINEFTGPVYECNSDIEEKR